MILFIHPKTETSGTNMGEEEEEGRRRRRRRERRRRRQKEGDFKADISTKQKLRLPGRFSRRKKKV